MKDEQNMVANKTNKLILKTPKQTRASTLRQLSTANKRTRQAPSKLRDFSTPSLLLKNKKHFNANERKKLISKVADSVENGDKKQVSHPDLCHLCQVVCTAECIQCGTCKKWFHNSCTLITERDNTLFDLCSISFNCVYCIVASVYNKVSLDNFQLLVNTRKSDLSTQSTEGESEDAVNNFEALKLEDNLKVKQQKKSKEISHPIIALAALGPTSTPTIDEHDKEVRKSSTSSKSHKQDEAGCSSVATTNIALPSSIIVTQPEDRGNSIDFLINQGLPTNDTSGRILDNSEFSPTSGEVNASSVHDNRDLVLSVSTSNIRNYHQLSATSPPFNTLINYSFCPGPSQISGPSHGNFDQHDSVVDDVHASLNSSQQFLSPDSVQNLDIAGNVRQEERTPTVAVVQSAIESVAPQEDDSLYVLTIDNINQSWKFKKSSTIKSEFNRYFPDILLQLAYSLRGGGIALHFNCTEDLVQVLNFRWPIAAFNQSGKDIVVRRVDRNPRLILKNVDPNLSVDKIEEILAIFTGVTVRVHRFKHHDSNKPIPVIKVICPPQAAEKIKTHSLWWCGTLISVEDFISEHRPDIDCYKCNSRGHTASRCPNRTYH